MRAGMTRMARLAWLALAALFLAACGDDLPPEWKITEYRVLAVVADPPEVDPDGKVALSVVDYDPAMNTATHTWSVCLFSFGSTANFACVDDQLDFALPSGGPTSAIDFGPDGLGLRALYEQYGPVPNAAGELQTLEDGFDVYVHLVSRAANGREESTYKRVRVRDGDDLNTNPVGDGFTIDEAAPGPIPAKEKVKIKLELPDTDREVDPDGDEETYLYQWLVVDGEIEEKFGFPSNAIDYTAPKKPGVYPVFVVVRDRRGGTAVERLNLTVVP